MKCAKHLVEREIDTAVIALEIAVMQLVMKMSQHQPLPVPDQQRMKTGMPKHRRERQHIAMKHHMHRVRWHHQMDQHRAEIDRMFNRMHRNA